MQFTTTYVCGLLFLEKVLSIKVMFTSQHTFMIDWEHDLLIVADEFIVH